MTETELMNAGELHYFDDEEINALSYRAQELLEQYNNTAANDEGTRTEILKKLLGRIDGWCEIH